MPLQPGPSHGGYHPSPIYLYNRIHELKRVFSALRLGVITNPVNPQDILAQGWRFSVDASVVVIDSGALSNYSNPELAANHE